jgi:hypothetical protein
MTIVSVAIVLFIMNASAVQPAGQSAFTYGILGFLAFLVPVLVPAISATKRGDRQPRPRS